MKQSSKIDLGDLQVIFFNEEIFIHHKGCDQPGGWHEGKVPGEFVSCRMCGKEWPIPWANLLMAAKMEDWQ